MDADRKAIYENKAAKTLAPELTKLSSKYDFQVVDLNSVFRNDWQKNRKAFDFGTFDSHWNAYAHNLVASFTAPSLDTEN